MSFLPIIGYPKKPYEKFNYQICKSAVGYIYDLMITNSNEISNIELDMRPAHYKQVYLEKEINSYLDKIEDFSFPGASFFKEGYYEAIREAIVKNKSIHFSHAPIDELVHNYLRPLKWDLGFSDQVIKEAESLEDRSEFEHYLIWGTDLLQRHPSIEEMGVMLFYCSHLFQLKLSLNNIVRKEVERSQLKIGKNYINEASTFSVIPIKFTEKHLGTDEDKIKELLEFLRDNLIIEKGNINDQRYYFNLLKGKPKATYPKIKWLKSIGLYKSFVKNILHGKGRYEIAAEIFELSGFESSYLIAIRDKHKTVKEISLEERMLKKALQKK
jgi:hypothetical protein